MILDLKKFKSDLKNIYNNNNNKMIRNFIRQSRPWTKNVSPILGRWNINDNIDRKVDLANIDHCGDRVCGDLYKESKSIIELFDKRWYGEISKDKFKQKLKDMKLKKILIL